MRPAPLGGQADGADQRAGRRAERERALLDGEQQGGGLDAERLDDVQREVRQRLAERVVDEHRKAAAHDEVERERAPHRAAAEPDPRHDEHEAGGEHDQQRLEDELELRRAEVELALEGRHPDQQAARQPDDAQVAHPCLLEVHDVGGLHRPHDLGLDDGDAQQRHHRAADQHEVRRAPERDVLAEEAVPEVVERKGGQGEQAGEHHQHAAERGVPVAGDADRGRAGAVGAFLVAEADREEAGREDAVQAAEDEEVAGVAPDALVASLVEVDRDVPVQAEDG